MKNIRVKDLITFRSLSERRQITFISNLQKEKIVKDEDDSSGGNYWVRSISALNRAFKENDNSFIKEKINDILNDYNPNLDNRTKVKYDRNLQILHNYEDFDFRSVTPSEEIEILLKIRKNGVIEVNGLDLKVEIHHIYTFDSDNKTHLGAVLFAAQKGGYKLDELGIFAEAIFMFLVKNYSEKYIIDPSFIKVIDVMTHGIVDYQVIAEGTVSSLLNVTVEDMKTFRSN